MSSRPAPGCLEIGPRVYAVDLHEPSQPLRSACFVIASPRPAVIETGGAHSRPHILAALDALAIPRQTVAWIAVTHVHLDHAGGAGLLASDLPGATVLVHPRGLRHLADPRRLVEGSREVYGAERLARFFGPVVPVPAHRLRSVDDGEAVDLGAGRRLIFRDAPGHARHHHAIFETGSRLLFSGDALGVWYPPLLARHGVEFVLPSTAPNQFDPEAVAATASRLVRELKVARVVPTHFGPLAMEPARLAERVAEQAARFAALSAGVGAMGDWPAVADRLREHLRRLLEMEGIAPDGDDWRVLDLDIEINARGLADYQARRLRDAEARSRV